jgi:hypothetical protein
MGSSLLRKSENYGCKKFYNIGPWRLIALIFFPGTLVSGNWTRQFFSFTRVARAEHGVLVKAGGEGIKLFSLQENKLVRLSTASTNNLV